MKKIDFEQLGITFIPNQNSLFRKYDTVNILYHFSQFMFQYGLTNDNIMPIISYLQDALYQEKPWPPNPPIDAPDGYSGPTFDA